MTTELFIAFAFANCDIFGHLSQKLGDKQKIILRRFGSGGTSFGVC